MNFAHEFLVEDREYKDYDDFSKHCRLKAPKDFNFAYDIIDRYAKLFHFGFHIRIFNQAANDAFPIIDTG